MKNMGYLEDILNFIDGYTNDLSYLFKDIQGYTDEELEKRLMKQLLRIKKIYLLGKKFKDNQKGKRKGTRFMYISQIRDAFTKGKMDLVNALITYARVDYKINNVSRQTLWRLKKELISIGIPEEIIKNLYL